MTLAAAHTVLTIVFAAFAVASFLIQGRQWPTAITATLFGVFLGATAGGGAFADRLATFLADAMGGAG